MSLLLAALFLSLPDDTAIRAQSWAKKAKPFASCATEQECSDKWQKAAAWIKGNTRFTIAVDEPNLLSTPGSIYANTDLSFTMTRTQQKDGTFSLNVYAWCGNWVSCNPKPKKAVARLKQVVEGN